jgi:hypothetical protein
MAKIHRSGSASSVDSRGRGVGTRLVPRSWLRGRDTCCVKSVRCIVERQDVLGAGCVRVVMGRRGVGRCVEIRRGERGSNGGSGKGTGKAIFGEVWGTQ